MSAPRRDRLEAYLATQRSGSLSEVNKGRVARWQRYAAVTGSAVALATNASLSSLGSAVRKHGVNDCAIGQFDGDGLVSHSLQASSKGCVAVKAAARLRDRQRGEQDQPQAQSKPLQRMHTTLLSARNPSPWCDLQHRPHGCTADGLRDIDDDLAEQEFRVYFIASKPWASRGP